MSNVNGQSTTGTASTMPPLSADESVKSTKSVTAEQVEIARLQAEIAKLKTAVAAKSPLKFKLSESSSCISVYGLNRFPVSLRRSQWRRLIAAVPDLERYMEKHDVEIAAAEAKDVKE